MALAGLGVACGQLLPNRDTGLIYRAQATCYRVDAGGDDPWTGELRFDGEGHVSLQQPGVPPLRRRSSWGEGPTPAAPDAECRVRARDRLEDILGLAYPRLPRSGDPSSAGWSGHTPTAACAQAACTGPRATCAASPWRERRISQNGSEVTVEGRFRVGEVSATRTAVIDRSRGLLTYSWVEVHTPTGDRTLRLTPCTPTGQGTSSTPRTS